MTRPDDGVRFQLSVHHYVEFYGIGRYDDENDFFAALFGKSDHIALVL